MEQTITVGQAVERGEGFTPLAIASPPRLCLASFMGGGLMESGYMERIEDGVARRLEVDTKCIAVMFESLESCILGEDALDEGSERELMDAESNHKELTANALLVREI